LLQVLLALLLGLLGGCRPPAPAAGPAPRVGEGSAPAVAAPEPQTLTVYCGRNENLVGPLLAAFEAETGHRLRVEYADSALLAARLVEEGPRTPADVYFSQDASTLAWVAGQALLRPLSEATLTRVPETFRGAEGRWVGTSGRARVVAWSTARLRAESVPGSLDALVDERWRGRIGWSPENASFQSFVAALVNERGAEGARAWLQAMQALGPRAYPGNTPLVRAVHEGEIDLALTNHYYLHRLRSELGEGFQVDNRYLADGTAGALVNLSGAGVLAGSRHPEAAEAFVVWLLSPSAQRWFVENTQELPLVEGITGPVSVPEPSALGAPVVDYSALGDLEVAVGLLRDTGILP
jgi:iron(III) transport system substrate-binding protein